MMNSQPTDFEEKNQAEISASVQNPSSSFRMNMLSFLKIVESLFLIALICAIALVIGFRDNQAWVIRGAILISLLIFSLITTRKLLQDFRTAANQVDIGRKAELYMSLSDLSNSLEQSPIIRARERAIQYCQELIEDYKKNRETSRNIYYTFQMATVILSGVTPILVLVDKLEAGQAWLKWLPVICPAIASIVASIVTSFPFQENWISANAAVELLEAEQEKFVLGVTPIYRCYDLTDESQYQQQAKMAIENFINQVNNIHLKQVQNSGEQPIKEEKKEEKGEANQSIASK